MEPRVKNSEKRLRFFPEVKLFFFQNKRANAEYSKLTKYCKAKPQIHLTALSQICFWLNSETTIQTKKKHVHALLNCKYSENLGLLKCGIR